MTCYLYNGIKYTEEGLVKLLQSQQPKTRRILELQSDLFQKGRDRKDLTKDLDNPTSNTETVAYDQYEENALINAGYVRTNENNADGFPYYEKIELVDSKENQFLQLLNKNNNWVTFFIRAIIQSTAKERIYEASLPDIEEKVLSLQKEGKLKIDCR